MNRYCNCILASGIIAVSPLLAETAVDSITGEDLARHVATLAADEFAGRAPSTEGEVKTLDYLESQLRRTGVEPVNGSYRQPVELLSKTVAGTPTVVFAGPAEMQMDHGSEILIGPGAIAPRVAIEEAQVVLAGFGIAAPEYGWNDYAGVDLAGKVALVFLGEPDWEKDETLFEGRALSYYGTNESKRAEAARRGAAGILYVHDQARIGYPWEVLTANAHKPKYDVERDAGPEPVLTGALSRPAAERLLAAAGLDYAEQLAAADAGKATATTLGMTLTTEFEVDIARSTSYNAVGLVRGRTRPDEVVVYTAHWDHVGVNDNAEGEDKIFNGAVDNATGTAALLEVAEAFARLDEKPDRSVLFIATTAEEQGLLGAYYYVENPLFPLESTAGVLNLDALFPFGEQGGMTVVGLGSSELEHYLVEAAKTYGRKVTPDSTPEVGAFFRSDHYPFARKGVPAIFAVGGPRDPENIPEDILARYQDYMTNGYHKPGDEYDADTWDMAGIVGDARIFFQAGLALAEDTRFPNWVWGHPFRPLRDQALRK